jgi:hypothetical protein
VKSPLKEAGISPTLIAVSGLCRAMDR